MKRFVAATLVTVLAMAPSAYPQTEPEMPKFAETLDIRVINVDVVVTDRKGQPVSGLTMNDFVVLENGREQKITNFYEVSAADGIDVARTAPAAAAAPQATPRPKEERPDHLKRKVVIFIDNLSLAPFNRNRVVKSMKDFIHQTLRPGDEAMIATWNRSMKVRLPFTGDVKQLEQTLEVIEGESSYGLQNMAERRAAEGQIRDAAEYHDAVQYARGYAQSVEHDLRQTVYALNGLMSTLAGVEGKKIVVLTSEGLPMQPGREMFYFIDDVKREKPNWRRHGSSMLEAMNFDSSSLIQSLARTANANDITLYALHAGGLMGNNEGSAENARPTPPLVQQAAVSNSTESLMMLADMTGGAATVGTNNFKAGFDRIRRDLDTYYSLGYRSATERVDRQRAIQVRAKSRNHVIRYRKSFVEKSVPSEMRDRVIANVFYPSRSNDMQIFLTTGKPVAVEADRFRVPVEIHIPVEKLTLLPHGETHQGGFSVYVVAANQIGDMSDVTQKSKVVIVPEAEMKLQTSGRFYTYSIELLMEKGRNRISVGVIDEVSRATGFERQEVLAADLS